MTGKDLCAEARERMQAFLDGLLDAADRRALEEHVALCAACREAFAEARRLASLLGGWARVAPSPRFTERVLAAIRLPAPAPAPRPVPARVVVALAAVALAITGVLLAPGTRDAFARLLAAGTQRGASDAVTLARVLATVLTGLVTVCETAATLVAPILAAARGLAVAIQHVSSGPLGFAAALTLSLALAAGVLYRQLVSPRERRGLHVLVF